MIKAKEENIFQLEENIFNLKNEFKDKYEKLVHDENALNKKIEELEENQITMKNSIINYIIHI